MRKATKELALCSMLAALSVVVLCLGGIVPFAVYACPMLASGALLLVREECRPSYAWCCWAAVAILALLLGPDKEASALYLFLGWYPLDRRPSGGRCCGGWPSWRWRRYPPASCTHSYYMYSAWRPWWRNSPRPRPGCCG